MKKALIKVATILVSALFAVSCTNKAEISESSVSVSGTSSEKSEDVITESHDIQTVDTEPAAEAGFEDEVKYEYIFVPEDPCLSNKPFMTVSVNDILKYYPDLKKTDSEEGANGHFVFFDSDGITYISHSAANGNVVGLVIYNDNYSLNCGIKPGMSESTLIKEIPFMDKYTKEDILSGEGKCGMIFSSMLLRDRISPLNNADYDSAYACITAPGEDERLKYGSSYTIPYTIIALIKDKKVNKIILDMPTAN